MASDLLTALKFNKIKALHDLVVTKFAQGRAISNDVFVWGAKSARNNVVVFGVRNAGTIVNNIAN